nr:YkgJ family cysteine cluster protein [Candidatus Sigynarchaeota archaeon]
MPESDERVFCLQHGGKKQYYRYKCTLCGECCRHDYVIDIRMDDVARWKQQDREDIVRGFQIDMKSLAPAAVIPLGWYKVHPIDQGTTTEKGSQKSPEMAFLDEHREGVNELVRFIVDNHVRVSNGLKNEYLPHWFLPDTCYIAIFQPKSIVIMKQGILKGIRYILINNLRGQCEFLQANLCSIHDTKPIVCQEYPNKDHLENDVRAATKFIEVCKGVNPHN